MFTARGQNIAPYFSAQSTQAIEVVGSRAPYLAEKRISAAELGGEFRHACLGFELLQSAAGVGCRLRWFVGGGLHLGGDERFQARQALLESCVLQLQL